MVSVDEDYLRQLSQKIRDYFEKRNLERIHDGKIHISDLTYCMRKAIIGRKWPEKVKMTIDDYVVFMDGLGSEKMLVEILNDDAPEGSTEYQKDVAFDEFSAHPDYVDENQTVFEFKTSNTIQHIVLSNDILKSYIRQTVYYMTLMGITEGKILVRYKRNEFPEYIAKDDIDCFLISDPKHKFVNDNKPMFKLIKHKDIGQFPFFAAKVELKYDAAVRSKITDGLINVIKPLYKTGDIEKLPRLENYPVNWKCQYCNVKDICDQIPDLQMDQYKRNILLNKHIDNTVNKLYHRHKLGTINDNRNIN